MYPLSVNNGQDYDQGITQRDALAFDVYARAVTNLATVSDPSCDPGRLSDDVLDVLATASLRAADVFIKRRDEYIGAGK